MWSDVGSAPVTGHNYKMCACACLALRILNQNKLFKDVNKRNIWSLNHATFQKSKSADWSELAFPEFPLRHSTIHITCEKRRLDLYIYCSNDWWIRIALNMTSQCSIEDFPPEILQLLFGQLNLKDLGNCSKTCVRWKLLIVDLFKNKGNYKGYIPFLKLSFLFKLRRHSITTWKRWGTR